MGNNASRYVHEALPGERYVRLCRVHPRGPDRRRESRVEKIRVSLEVFALDDAPAYTALSYTWGDAMLTDEGAIVAKDPETLPTISVGKNPVSVTPNLFAALSRLQKRVGKYIWIDALCIDQTNTAERSSQVLLMGDIYSLAKKVIVWLGERDEDADAVTWATDVVYPLVDRGGAMPLLASSEPEQLQAQFGMSREEWLRRWKSFNSFHARRRWFSRAWIVQEYVLARKLALYVGDTELDFHSLVGIAGMASLLLLAPQALRLLQLNTMRSPAQSDAEFTSEGMRRIFSTFHAKTSQECWLAYVVCLVIAVQSQDAKDARDKIYAVLGIAEKLRPEGLEKNHFGVDYSSSPEDVFLDFTLKLLDGLPSLTALGLVDDVGFFSRQDLPSWCRDFGGSRPCCTLAMVASNKELGPFCAAPLSQDQFPVCHINGRRLEVRGRILAAISAVSQSPVAFASDFSDISNHDACKAMDSLIEVCVPLGRTCNNGRSKTEVLARTILGGLEASFLALPGGPLDQVGTVEECFAAFVLLFEASRLGDMETSDAKRYIERLNSRFEALGSGPELLTVEEIVNLFENDVSPRGKSTEHYDRLTNEFLRALLLVCYPRALFSTVDGQWLGLGPQSASAGDEIWLVVGSPTPLTLRPKGNRTYTLVGDTYVHGIMHGELLRDPVGQDGFGGIAIV